ncbi:UNKNOWN [Stylonychia lemnae]|uniref:Uncharacterized protein n=1 Tax=Stylonychia lemnae TaxID=5949 RepID=A0A078B924_STYLE|nr:UNKNOWN [Stylonychia lemnae]|eukprot:CDW90058.1 UNKNOWN [Stylonychia lemnae]
MPKEYHSPKITMNSLSLSKQYSDKPSNGRKVIVEQNYQNKQTTSQSIIQNNAKAKSIKQGLSPPSYSHLRKFLTNVSSTKIPPRPLQYMITQEPNEQTNQSQIITIITEDTQTVNFEPPKPLIEQNTLNLGIAISQDESHITMGLGDEAEDCTYNKTNTDRSKLLFSRGESQFDILSSVNIEDNVDKIFREYEVQVRQQVEEEIQKQLQKTKTQEIELMIFPEMYDEQNEGRIIMETDKSETVPTMPNERSTRYSQNQNNRKYLMMKHAKNNHSRDKLEFNKFIQPNQKQQIPVIKPPKSPDNQSILLNVLSKKNIYQTADKAQLNLEYNALETEKFNSNEKAQYRINANVSQEYLDFIHNSKLLVQQQTEDKNIVNSFRPSSVSRGIFFSFDSNKKQYPQASNSKKKSLIYNSQISSPERIRGSSRCLKIGSDQFCPIINLNQANRLGDRDRTPSINDRYQSSTTLLFNGKLSEFNQTAPSTNLEQKIQNVHQLLNQTLKSNSNHHRNIKTQMNAYDSIKSTTSLNQIASGQEKLLKVNHSSKLKNQDLAFQLNRDCRSVTNFNVTGALCQNSVLKPSEQSPFRVDLQFYRPNSTLQLNNISSSKTLVEGQQKLQMTIEEPQQDMQNKIINEKHKRLLKSIKGNIAKNRRVAFSSLDENKLNLINPNNQTNGDKRLNKYLNHKHKQLGMQELTQSQPKLQISTHTKSTVNCTNQRIDKLKNQTSFQALASKTQNLAKFVQNKVNKQTQETTQKKIPNINTSQQITQAYCHNSLERKQSESHRQKVQSKNQHFTNHILHHSQKSKVQERNKENL